MHMNKKILILLVGIIFLILFVRASIVENKYVLLEFQYKDGQIKLINKTLETGQVPAIEHVVDRQYEIDLISEDDRVLYSNIFDPTKLFSDVEIDGNMEGGTLELEETIFYISVPEIKENKKIQVLKDKQIIFEEEIYDVGASPCRIK